MQPPADIEPRDLWMQIIAMPRPHRLVPFPRRGDDGAPLGELAMQVLQQEECIAAKASAERYVRKLLKDPAAKDAKPESGQGYEDLSELRDALELLYRACRKPDDLSKPFFPTVEAIGKGLTTDEIAVLVLNYRRVQSELGPIVSEMSQEELDAWVDVLAKGGSMFPFDSLSLGAQTALVRYMARRLRPSATDSSSPGQPPEEPTPGA